MHLRIAASRVRLLAIGRRGAVLPVEPEVAGGRVVLEDIEPWGFRVVLA